MPQLGDIARFRSRSADQNGPVFRRPAVRDPDAPSFFTTHREKVVKIIENEPGLSYHQIVRALGLPSDDQLITTRVSALLHQLFRKEGRIKRRKLDGLFRYYALNYIDPRGGTFDDPNAPKRPYHRTAPLGSNARIYQNLTGDKILDYLARNPGSTSQDVFVGLEPLTKPTKARGEAASRHLERLAGLGKVVAVRPSGESRRRRHWYLADANGEPILGRLQGGAPPQSDPAPIPTAPTAQRGAPALYPELAPAKILALLKEEPGLTAGAVRGRLQPGVRGTKASIQVARQRLLGLMNHQKVDRYREGTAGRDRKDHWFALDEDGQMVGYDEWFTHHLPLSEQKTAPVSTHIDKTPVRPSAATTAASVERLAKDFIWDRGLGADAGTVLRGFVEWIKENHPHG